MAGMNEVDAADAAEAELSGAVQTALLIVTVVVASVNAFFLLFLFMSTIWGDTRGTIRSSEKVILYNVIIPDVLLTVFLFAMVCPATYNNNWRHSTRATAWLGFLYLLFVFHAPLAMAVICNLMALSSKEPARYEGMAKNKKLIVLCLSYLGISISLCSLPVTELTGLKYNPYWFSPTLSVKDGPAGVFTTLGMAGLSIILIACSLRDHLQMKRNFGDSLRKVPKKVIQELDQAISFTSLCLVHTVVLFVPMVLPLSGHIVCFVLRLVLYLAPVCRVLMLTRACPHFKFLLSDNTEQDVMDEFALLSAED